MLFTDLTWSLWDFTILLACTVAALYVWGTWTHNHFKKRNIPYIKPVPFLGNNRISLFSKNKEYFPQFILRVYRELKGYPYGGVFSFTQPAVLLRDPELINTVTVKEFDHFTDHRAFFDEDVEPLWGKSLFNLSGKRWKGMRSVLSPAFTSSKMKTMFVLVEDCCQQLVSFLEDCYEHPPEEGFQIHKEGDVLILELKEIYARYSNDVIATTAFGIAVDSLKQPKNEFYTMGQKAFMSNLSDLKIFGYLLSPKLMHALGTRIIPKNVTEFFRSMIHETVTKREQEGIVRPDMIQLLMEAKKGVIQEEKQEKTSESEEDVKPSELDNDDIAAQALIFFLGGFDTTSSLLSFASHQLAVHPEIQTRLQEEIDKTLEENGGKFTYEAVNSMKYLNMVISETLRKFPPVAAGDRQCVKPCTLETEPPLEVQPGDTLLIPVYALHHDPELFPDPDRFDPERFSDENKRNINHLAYIPFGEGPRSCIGNRFGLMEAKLALVHLLSHFSLKVIDKSPVPIQIRQTGFSMSVEGGFWFGLELRNS